MTNIQKFLFTKQGEGDHVLNLSTSTEASEGKAFEEGFQKGFAQGMAKATHEKEDLLMQEMGQLRHGLEEVINFAKGHIQSGGHLAAKLLKLIVPHLFDILARPEVSTAVFEKGLQKLLERVSVSPVSLFVHPEKLERVQQILSQKALAGIEIHLEVDGALGIDDYRVQWGNSTVLYLEEHLHQELELLVESLLDENEMACKVEGQVG
jgi:flagellar biosynthesis/type III secretory pathway protein FliH